MTKHLKCILLFFPFLFYSQEKKKDSINKIIEKQIQEVEITAKKKLIERKVDRLVFNVENSISATGGDALDALKITPSIRVQNDQISMIGKSNMAIMINDRLMQLSGESLINFLKTIPSDEIKSIEVITTPPAKYDAEGNSGIVNIKLKKIKKDDIFKASLRSSYQQSTYATGSVGSNISTQIKKTSLISSINYENGSYKVTENHKYFYPTELWNQNNKRREFNKSLSGRLGVDYQLSEKSEIGFLYLGEFDKPSNQELDNTILVNSNNNLPTGYTETIASRKINNYLHSINTHYKKDFDSLGKSISANIDYLISNQKTDRDFRTNSLIDDVFFLQSALNSGNQYIKIFTSGVDIELPFEKIKYTFGGKLSFINTDNSFDYFDTTSFLFFDTTKSNKFKYNENIQALYASVEKKMKDWEFQFGLRGEFTQTKGYSENLDQTNKNKYFRLFPTFYISYSLNDDNIFNINYSKRIGRPDYYMANPFRVYQNQFSYVEGNPFIQPEYVHSIELSHTFKNNLSTKLNFTHLEDGKSQVEIINPSQNTSQTTYLNYFKANTFNINIDYAIKKWKWWESNNSVVFTHNYVMANESLNMQQIKTNSFYISSLNTFIFNSSKTFLASLQTSYQSPFGININKFKGIFNTNLSFKYLLLDKNMQIALIINDLFKTSKSRSSSFSNNILINNDTYYDNQFFRIAVSYKFGNRKLNVKQHETGNTEEKERAYNGN